MHKENKNCTPISTKNQKVKMKEKEEIIGETGGEKNMKTGRGKRRGKQSAVYWTM